MVKQWNWVLQLARKRTDATFQLVDVKDHDLPLLDEPGSPSQGIYTHAHTQRWSAPVWQRSTRSCS